MNRSLPIDFVITWVDGSDREWLEERKKYRPNMDIDDSIARYRDFDTLKYLLRSVDKFAPWVRKIFLVTNGQIPDWLSLSNHKLTVVKHSDFIPHEYLPTFSSHPIEWNMHRIEGLSENFVYFNDDMILTSPVQPSDFFQNDQPRDIFGLGLVQPREFFSHIPFNNMLVLNKHFNFKKTLKEHRKKFFCMKYGLRTLKTLVLSKLGMFYGIYDPHIILNLRKSVISEIWETEYDLIHSTCKNKFRSSEDVSIWLARYWQLLKGDFKPSSNKFGKFYVIHDFVKEKNITINLKNGKWKCICVNDSDRPGIDFENEKSLFSEIMNCILSEKCEFEK